VYTIGEFSRITGLSIKALRLYHEKGILVPSAIDTESNYRYYDSHNVEQARIITHLRDLQFGLVEIADILDDVEDDCDVVAFFEKKKIEISTQIRNNLRILRDLNTIIKNEKGAIMASQSTEFQVEEKDLEPILIAGIRYKGKYSDCGKYFGKLGKSFGGVMNGNPFNLYYDGEVKETDADIESCFPIRKAKDVEGVSVRELPGGHCVSLIHKGSYETIGRSYEKVLSYIKEKGYTPQLPSREICIKGPGMIFKGNPENYLTEIQVMI
jgi:DNA-binding transcriptional MerR regulator/effector-binding domain-containing protein